MPQSKYDEPIATHLADCANELRHSIYDAALASDPTTAEDIDALANALRDALALTGQLDLLLAIRDRHAAISDR